jgi:hypothetical protein
MAMPPSDIGADDVAAMVVAAIEANAPYIITHPHNWAGVERRIHALEAAFGVRR